MNVHITFNTDNASFEDYPQAELLQVLDHARAEIIGALENDAVLIKRLRDTNGNTVGLLTVTDA